jgi:two-component system, response regulator PdtaR
VEHSTDSQSVVLIVEDEALVRMSAVDMVGQTGCRILEAVNADEALDVLTNRTDIRVLFTDVEMPGSMDGYRLARTVRERWPGIAIVITSGRKAPGLGDLLAGGRFLAKPYEAFAVAQTLSEFVA